MRLTGILGCLVPVLLCAGCASVTQGTTHPVRIETITRAGVLVDGADCTLSNDQGTTIAKSGQSTVARRSGKDLDVVCRQGGLPDASARLVSRANVGLAGNIIIGGGVGAIIDHNTGAAYTYPTWVRLVFGEHAVFDRSQEREGTVMLSPGSPVAQAMPAVPVAIRALTAGSRFNYVVTDRASGRRYDAVLRADAVDGGQVSFNGGARVEKVNGEVVRVNSALVGELDQVTPPGGWMPGGKMPAGIWKMRHASAVPGSSFSYDLEGSSEGEQKLTIGGAEVRTVRIAMRGWVESRGTGHMAVRAPYRATAWLAPELNRVVRFEAQARSAGNAGAAYFHVDEVAELVGMAP